MELRCSQPTPDEHLVKEEEDIPLPNWAAHPGLGSAEYPGFPSDGSAPLPDISEHQNLAMKLFRENVSLFERLKDVQTPAGVKLAKCVKTGVDNKGNRLIRMMGVVAGDAACYDVFEELFLSHYQ